MTPEESTTIVGYLLAAFRPRDWSDASSAVYIETLAELDFDRAMQAARYLVRGERFMPSVSEIREEYAGLYEIPEGRPELPAASAELAMTNEEVAAFVAETRQRLAEAGPRGAKPLAMTPDEIAREGQAEPEYDPGPGPIQGTYDPIQATNGPPCPLDKVPTVHNGGSLWWCQDCGWVVRRAGALT